MGNLLLLRDFEAIWDTQHVDEKRKKHRIQKSVKTISRGGGLTQRFVRLGNDSKLGGWWCREAGAPPIQSKTIVSVTVSL